MFKDADQELARLEAELLKEEEPEEILEEEEELFEEDLPEEELPPEYYYEDTRAADGPVIYQNYSNDYGKGLRNYASGYRAYNSDVCDEDLDDYSEEVLEGAPARRNTGLVLTACLLALAIAGVAIFLFLWYRGIL